MDQQPKPQRGRPRRETAASHDDILDAVYTILQTKSVRDLTIEEVARHAKVGKPTIYKWWPSKAALVMEMFEQRIAPQLAVPSAATAEQAIRAQVTELVGLLNGFFGKVAAEIIAEGQSEPDVLREYRERYLFNRRSFSRDAVTRAIASGEFKRPIDPELLIDMIYGPIYYRLLVRHQPLDKNFADELVNHVMAYVRG